MFKSIPNPAIEMTREEPPKLMKGKGSPVKGRVAVTTPMLIRAWMVSQEVTPAARSVP